MAFYITKPNATAPVVVPEKNFYQELERAVTRVAQSTNTEYTVVRTDAITELRTGQPVLISGTKFEITH